MALTPVAVYRRTITASLARIWENVLDWEHLPWLHRTTFRHVKVLDQHAEGWRAESALHAPGSGEFVLDVALERANLRYHSRTVEGAGAGTDILTHLEPVGPHATRITVEFLVPDVDPARAGAIGAAYTRLYAQLWDEDERMMVRRQQLLDIGTPPRPTPPVSLGSERELRTRLPLVLDAHGQRLRIVDLDGALVAHATTCPHRGGPLDDAPLEDGCITCPWHGYRYDLRTGASADGRTLRLDPAPRVVRAADGTCALVWTTGPEETHPWRSS